MVVEFCLFVAVDASAHSSGMLFGSGVILFRTMLFHGADPRDAACRGDVVGLRPSTYSKGCSCRCSSRPVVDLERAPRALESSVRRHWNGASTYWRAAEY